MPVIFPGGSWDNLQRFPPGKSLVPREGGDFFWRQFATASDLGIDMVKIAMFDEVDEGTAIFKVTNSPPTQGYFVTLQNKPTDWYSAWRARERNSCTRNEPIRRRFRSIRELFPQNFRHRHAVKAPAVHPAVVADYPSSTNSNFRYSAIAGRLVV